MEIYNILKYGAVPDELCTKALQSACDAAGENKATVVIPPGVFMTGTVNIGNASLYLEKGAVLKGSGDIADYPPINYNHNEMGDVKTLLYSMDGSGIVIHGEGVIDLNGGAFFDQTKRDIPQSKVPLSETQLDECTLSIGARPNQPLFFYNCRNLTIKGITIQDAPCWTLCFIESRNISVTDLKIDNSLNIPNNDGMHFCSCKDVIVRGCNISSGDDCIALSAITGWEEPCERVVISDCILHSCSKAIVLGYMHSIVRDVLINNCCIYDSNRAFAIMASAGTGLVENIIVSNMRLDTRIRAGNWWGNGEPVCLMAVKHHAYRDAPPKRDYPVNIRNIHFCNLVCSGENVIGIVGENGNIEHILFEHISFKLKDSSNLPIKGRIIDLAPGEQTAALPDDGKAYWLYIRQARDVRVENAVIEPFHDMEPIVSTGTYESFGV